jgi:hypothetical protein
MSPIQRLRQLLRYGMDAMTRSPSMAQRAGTDYKGGAFNNTPSAFFRARFVQ